MVLTTEERRRPPGGRESVIHEANAGLLGSSRHLLFHLLSTGAFGVDDICSEYSKGRTLSMWLTREG